MPGDRNIKFGAAKVEDTARRSRPGGEICDVKAEAVVTHCEPLTTKEMRYHRLSLWAKNMTNQIIYLGVHIYGYLQMVSKYAKILAVIAL